MRESVPPRDICPFVMYCVNGKPCSSLLIESTDSMIYIYMGLAKARPNYAPWPRPCIYILRMIRERQVILKAALHFRLAV